MSIAPCVDVAELERLGRVRVESLAELPRRAGELGNTSFEREDMRR